MTSSNLRYKIGTQTIVRDALKEPGDVCCGAAKTQNHHQISDRLPPLQEGQIFPLWPQEVKPKVSYIFSREQISRAGQCNIKKTDSGSV